MCPGGTVVAATSEPGRVVTNGMSQYSRNERNANAGIVVGITPEDYRQDGAAGGPVNPLAGIAFQRRWESRAFELGGGGYEAPGQLVGDFLEGQRVAARSAAWCPRTSRACSSTDLAEPGRGSLPDYAIAAIREALPAFERQIKGFAMPDAVLTGVETRTSSPLRITRGARLAEPERRRPVPGRRRRGLCRRHHVGRRRRHRGGRGAGAQMLGLAPPERGSIAAHRGRRPEGPEAQQHVRHANGQARWRA